MPIYEFLCTSCRRKSSILIRRIEASVNAQCLHCGSTHIVRTVSCFAYHKTMETIHEETGEPGKITQKDYYKDPRNIGRWTEQKFRRMGVEIPSQIQETIQKAREGELPESMKDLGNSIPDAAYH